MNAQLDIFGADETAVRSFPPHLDPARVHDYDIQREADTDHVAAVVAGVLPVGALGNNRDVWLVQVLDKDREILASFPFATYEQAFAKLSELRDTVDLNRQQTLF